MCSVGYVVLTSVDRDDMPDGGSDHFARTVKALKVSSFVSSIHTHSIELLTGLMVKLDSHVTFTSIMRRCATGRCRLCRLLAGGLLHTIFFRNGWKIVN